MAKKILLIESDGAFAHEMSAAIEARGCAARVTADGKEGLDLARVDRPDLIVLCVELPKMSGYSVCNKLKKDDELRSIPLLIISAEATPETFDQHRKLKTHADDYLIKPFSAAELLQKIAGLVELPAQAADDELVTLDDVEELESLGAAPVELEAVPAAPAEDDDLKLLDDAFDSLASGDATGMTAIAGTPPPFAPARSSAVATAGDPDLEVALEVEPLPAAVAPPPDVDRLGDEADAALAALGEDEVGGLELPDPATFLDDDDSTASGEDLLRQAGIEVEPPPAPASAGVPQAAPRAGILPPTVEPARAAEPDAGLRRELESVRAALEEQRAWAAATTAALEAAEEQARAARAEADESAARAGREEEARCALEESVKEAEARAAGAERRAAVAEESTRAAFAQAEAAERQAAEHRREADAARHGAEAARHDAERSSGEAAQARERAEELAKELRQAQARAAEHESALAALRSDFEALGSELAEAHATVASTRADLERTLAEREKRLAELEAQNAKHEERVVKAYQKIKGDEKIREKTRKALAIALQLLEERSPAAANSGDVLPRRE